MCLLIDVGRTIENLNATIAEPAVHLPFRIDNDDGYGDGMCSAHFQNRSKSRDCCEIYEDS